MAHVALTIIKPQPLPYANTCAMQEFLEEIPGNVHQDHHALVIMDRAPWHMTGKLHQHHFVMPSTLRP